jgi:hypothetical protein
MSRELNFGAADINKNESDDCRRSNQIRRQALLYRILPRNESGKERMETGPRRLPEIAPAPSELFTGRQILSGILYQTPQRQKSGFLPPPVLDRVP